MAQEEIASKAGYEVNGEDQTLEVALLNKDLMEVLPGVEEANAISEELDKNVRFEMMLVAPQFLGKSGERTEVAKIILSMELNARNLNNLHHELIAFIFYARFT